MNILSVTNALKGIKLKELDDEFQIEIMRSLNQALPDGVNVTAESTGDEIRRIIDVDVPVLERNNLMQVDLMTDHKLIVRFFNNIERIQLANEKDSDYEDSLKGNIFASGAWICVIIVSIAMALYVLSADSRGKVPESRTWNLIQTVASALTVDPTTIIDQE